MIDASKNKRLRYQSYYLKSTFYIVLLTYVLVGIIYAVDIEDYYLLLAGFVVQITFSAYMFSKKVVYFLDPVVLLLMAVYLGVVFKIPYLIANPHTMNYLLLGKDKSIFVEGTVYIYIACVFFIAGVVSQQLNSFRRHSRVSSYGYKWNLSRFRLLSLILLALSLMSTVLLISDIGLSSLSDSFSQKRFQDLDDRTSRLTSSLYIYYKISLISKFTLYSSFVYLIVENSTSSNRMNYFPKLVFIISFVISMATPVMLSARAAAGLAIFDIILIALAAGYKFRKSHLVAIGLMIVIPFAYATAERSGADINFNIFASLFDHRYFLDLTKTAHIINYFREAGEYYYGESLIGWLFLPIPSSVVDNKPWFIEVGLYLGWVVFGFQGLVGVPPGFVAELYMNFGLLGICFGMFFLGYIMQLLFSVYIRDTKNIVMIVMIAMLASRFFIFLFNSDFGTFMIKNILELVPMMFFLKFLLRRVHK